MNDRYDPVTGRWLSKDPIGISGGLNQYVAFENNPVNFRDPYGHSIISLWNAATSFFNGPAVTDFFLIVIPAFF